ncbi:MAG: caspase family protein [Salinivirgaceae bacterium]|nr:caspase family protein [Salinivirgaceae bacterium]
MRLKTIIFLIVIIICVNVNSQSIGIPVRSENYEIIASNIARITIPRRIKIEHEVAKIDTLFKIDMELYTKKQREQKIITDNIKTSVVANVKEETDTNTGNSILNLHVEYKYEVIKALIENQTEDFPMGKYKLLASNAAKITMQLLKKAVENQLSEYLSSGTKVTIKITGSTDGTPITSKIPYLGEYGDFINAGYFLNGYFDELSITKETGIVNNAQLAFLRTYSVRDFIDKYVEQFRVTQNTYQHFAIVAKERGAQYRRISVEIIIQDAFRNKFLDTNEGSLICLAKNNNMDINPTIVDIDVNIPTTKTINPHAYALIIGNEDYSSYQSDLSSEVNVAYAVNDANIFRNYILNTFGIPESNIKFLSNATSGQMYQAIAWINKIIQKEGGSAEVVVYYAGHGLPDEKTNEPYIIPVDVSATNLQSAIKLHTLYTKLTEYPSKKITVFMDACFSGGSRGQGLLASRGVKVKPKQNLLTGNIVVFTSSSGEQSSLPFKDKQHGMFTYYLLKKIQETNGDISYNDLYNYVKKEVDLNCVKVNSKEQTPNILYSIELGENWMDWKLK